MRQLRLNFYEFIRKREIKNTDFLWMWKVLLRLSAQEQNIKARNCLFHKHYSYTVVAHKTNYTLKGFVLQAVILEFYEEWAKFLSFGGF